MSANWRDVLTVEARRHHRENPMDASMTVTAACDAADEADRLAAELAEAKTTIQQIVDGNSYERCSTADKVDVLRAELAEAKATIEALADALNDAGISLSNCGRVSRSDAWGSAAAHARETNKTVSAALRRAGRLS